MILLHHKMIRKPISHSDWILSFTQIIPLSYYDCDCLIRDRVFEYIPPGKYHHTVFPSQQDMKYSICVIRGGGVGTWANFYWVCAAGLPQPPSLYSKFSFLAFIIKPRYILVHFFSIFYSVIFNYFIVRCSILTDIAPFKYF